MEIITNPFPAGNKLAIFQAQAIFANLKAGGKQTHLIENELQMLQKHVLHMCCRF